MAELMEGSLKKIKGAWIAALVSGTLTLGVVAYVVFSGSSMLSVDEWVLIDVVIIYGLAFGIYKKSRVAAVSMFVYFIINKVMMYFDGETRGTWMAAIFLFLFAQGVHGCFQYHSLKKRSNSQA